MGFAIIKNTKYKRENLKGIYRHNEKWGRKSNNSTSIKKLNSKEKEIIAKRFFDGRTQMKVADEIDI